MQQKPEKLGKRLGKMEKRPATLVIAVSDASEAFLVIIWKSTIFKIRTFNGSGPWELYHK